MKTSYAGEAKAVQPQAHMERKARGTNKKRRRTKPAPDTPAKGLNRTEPGRRPRAGAWQQVLLLLSREPANQLKWRFRLEAVPDATHQFKFAAASRPFNWLALNSLVVQTKYGPLYRSGRRYRTYFGCGVQHVRQEIHPG